MLPDTAVKFYPNLKRVAIDDTWSQHDNLVWEGSVTRTSSNAGIEVVFAPVSFLILGAAEIIVASGTAYL